MSSKAAAVRENKKTRYNGYEFNSDLDINLYESFYRSHDPQLGRFWQEDPKPNEFESLYAAMGNGPFTKFDLLGDVAKLVTERQGKDGEDDLNRFLELLSKVTGNTYEVKDGILVRTSKELNGKSSSKISGKLSALVESMIKSEETTTFQIANSAERDKDITFDNYLSGSLDLKDFNKAEKVDNAFLAAMFGHVIGEHSNTPNIKDRTPKNKKESHDCGIEIETSILSDMLGKKLSNRKDVQGKSIPMTKEITVSQFTFDYGNVQYLMRQQILTYNQGTNSTPYSSGIIIDIYRKK